MTSKFMTFYFSPEKVSPVQCYFFRTMRIAFSKMTYHQDNGCVGVVRRLSTPSWGSMTYKNKPFVTEWLWYWLDEHSSWKLYGDAEKIEEAYIKDQNEYAFTVDTTGFSYTLDLKGKRHGLCDDDPGMQLCFRMVTN